MYQPIPIPTHLPVASFLTLPSELRNAIYTYIFGPDETSNFRENQPSLPPPSPNPLAIALKLQSSPICLSVHVQNELGILRTCKQIYFEAHLLAISLTPFHIHGEGAHPETFALRTQHLSRPQLAAIRHVVLTARISHLRALNEAWEGVPFGQACMSLDTLVVVPTRPAVCSAAYAEIADLSQCHTLAHVFCETLKQLRRVKCVEVRNEGCFNEVVWRLMYRGLVYRMWRWGGGKCGIWFESGERCSGGSGKEENQWFKVRLHEQTEGAIEVGEEVARLVGVTDVPEPTQDNHGSLWT